MLSSKLLVFLTLFLFSSELFRSTGLRRLVNPDHFCYVQIAFECSFGAQVIDGNRVLNIDM